jgi:hypothetical protein
LTPALALHSEIARLVKKVRPSVVLPLAVMRLTNLRSLAFTLGALLFVVTALTGIVVLPVVLNFIGYFKLRFSSSS